MVGRLYLGLFKKKNQKLTFLACFSSEKALALLRLLSPSHPQSKETVKEQGLFYKQKQTQIKKSFVKSHRSNVLPKTKQTSSISNPVFKRNIGRIIQKVRELTVYRRWEQDGKKGKMGTG